MTEREITLDKKKILIVDGAFSPNDISKASMVCTDAPLVRKGSSNPAENGTQHYVSKSTLEATKQSSLFRIVETAVRKHFLTKPHCYRIVYREIVFGDHMTYHYDASERAVTAMVYMNDSWHENNHGETLFLDENGIGNCVMPMPGRLVIFDSSLKHSSSSPSRIYFGARQVLVFNFSEAG